jgi:hypothetical protein
MIELLRRYKWYLIVSLVAYAAISFWLFFVTESPQNVPFEYQVF